MPAKLEDLLDLRDLIGLVGLFSLSSVCSSWTGELSILTPNLSREWPFESTKPGVSGAKLSTLGNLAMKGYNSLCSGNSTLRNSYFMRAIVLLIDDSIADLPGICRTEACFFLLARLSLIFCWNILAMPMRMRSLRTTINASFSNSYCMLKANSWALLWASCCFSSNSRFASFIIWIWVLLLVIDRTSPLILADLRRWCYTGLCSS